VRRGTSRRRPDRRASSIASPGIVSSGKRESGGVTPTGNWLETDGLRRGTTIVMKKGKEGGKRFEHWSWGLRKSQDDPKTEIRIPKWVDQKRLGHPRSDWEKGKRVRKGERDQKTKRG